MESRSISKIVASWLMAKPFSLSRMACARILVRQFGSVLWISLRRKRSSSVMGATNLVAVLIVGIVPENFCFATYLLQSLIIIQIAQSDELLIHIAHVEKVQTTLPIVLV